MIQFFFLLSLSFSLSLSFILHTLHILSIQLIFFLFLSKKNSTFLALAFFSFVLVMTDIAHAYYITNEAFTKMLYSWITLAEIYISLVMDNVNDNERFDASREAL